MKNKIIDKVKKIVKNKYIIVGIGVSIIAIGSVITLIASTNGDEEVTKKITTIASLETSLDNTSTKKDLVATSTKIVKLDNEETTIIFYNEDGVKLEKDEITSFSKELESELTSKGISVEINTTAINSESTKVAEVISSTATSSTVAVPTTVEQVTKVTSVIIKPTTAPTTAPTTVAPAPTEAPTTIVQPTTEAPTIKTYYYNNKEVSALEYQIQTNPLNENAPAGSTLTWATNEWGFYYNLIMPQFSSNEWYYANDSVYEVKEVYKGTTIIDAYFYWFIIYSDNSYVVKLKPENSLNSNHK